MPVLRRTSPEQPGWTRRRAGKGFVYLDERGERLGDEDAERCRALVIPPAWRDVWICPYPRGHLQAVGTDEAGRRQYIYHPAWVEQRSAEKYDRVLRFGRRLPRVRERVLTDLALGDVLPSRWAARSPYGCWTSGYFRIGNDVYADGERVVRADDAGASPRTPGRATCWSSSSSGKSGIEHRIEVDDPLVIGLLDRMRRRRSQPDPSLPGLPRRSPLALAHARTVNEYLREASGLDATAKDFRTWHATVIAAAALAEAPGPEASKTARKRAVAATMQEVAEYLGNTPDAGRGRRTSIRGWSTPTTRAAPSGNAVRRTYDDPDQRQAALERAVLRYV